ncbi:MAG: hypothetical protein IH944_02275 [Armatimonadetes bacterium]|nr:hypothetical protein [Armatimonadota bacterium]
MPKSYYPPKSLKEALKLPKKILEANAGHPMYRPTLADNLGFTSSSEIFRQLITAGGQYGLTKGSYNAENIDLGDNARAAVSNDFDKIYDILFGHDLFAKVHDRYKNAAPVEQAVLDFLKKEGGVADAQAKGVFDGIINNMRDWNLLQSVGGADRIVPRDRGLSGLKESGKGQQTAKNENPTPPVQTDIKPPADPEVEPQTVKEPEVHIDIQVHISHEMSAEQIDQIFKSMGEHIYRK